MRNLTAALIPLLSLALTGLLWVNHAPAAARTLEDLPAPATTDLSEDPFTHDIWTFDGEQGSELGWAVHTAGDVDGDGYADILVGAPLYLVDDYRPGTVFLFYGGTFGVSWYGLGDQGVQLAVSEALDQRIKGSQFGFAVGTAGDVDNDGYDDILVGVPEYKVTFEDQTTTKSGAVFIYYGSPDRSESGLGAALAPFVEAEDKGIALGWAVSAAGDVDGDGFDDVIVSAPQYNNKGKVYLHRGGPGGLSPDYVWSYECNQSGVQCGNALSAAGDVNGDGFDDILVGAPVWDKDDSSDEGRALVFYGCDPDAEQPACLDGLHPEPAWSLTGGQEYARFGQAVAGAGDVDGDGFDDILVGAPGFTREGDLAPNGAAFLFLGSEDGPSLVYDWASYGEAEYAYYGGTLHRAGDVDADGYADVLVGSQSLDESSSCAYKANQGAAYLFTGGGSGLSADPAWVACGDKTEAYFGSSLGTAGDVDGDGADDILVGAYNFRLDDVFKGRAFAYLTGLDYGYVFLPLVVNP